MSSTAVAAPGSMAPRRTAIVLATIAFVLLAALAIGYVLHRAQRGGGTSGISATEQASMDAARQEVANLTTYTRATFDADWQRALGGTTGQLNAGQQSKKASTLAGLTKSKVDSRGEVTWIGVTDSTAEKVDLLVYLNVYSVASGKSTLTSSNRLAVTETKVDGKWLMSDLQSVGLT